LAVRPVRQAAAPLGDWNRYVLSRVDYANRFASIGYRAVDRIVATASPHVR
jgi:hypothetical protein